MSALHHEILGNKPIGILLGFNPTTKQMNIQRIGEDNNMTTPQDVQNENFKDLYTINLAQIKLVDTICKLHGYDNQKRVDMFDDLIDMLKNAKLENNIGLQVVSGLNEERMKQMFNKIK